MFEHTHNIKPEDICTSLAGVWKLPPIIGSDDNLSAENQIFSVVDICMYETGKYTAVEPGCYVCVPDNIVHQETSDPSIQEMLMMLMMLLYTLCAYDISKTWKLLCSKQLI